MTESHEEAVVAKDARVVEEIRLRKEGTDRDHTVKETVRKHEVEIDNGDKATGTAVRPIAASPPPARSDRKATTTARGRGGRHPSNAITEGQKAMNRLLLTTALVCATTAGAYAQTDATPNNNDCNTLVGLITQKKIVNSTVTLQQARVYQKDANNGACHKVLASNEASDGSATGAQVDIRQPAAQVQVRQPSANVSVKQAQPQVTVNQGQPTIIVHQPAPTVTVNVPEPIITIRMPQPDVDVEPGQAADQHQPAAAPGQRRAAAGW